jgi:biopolymer transport protein ExbD
MSALPRAEINVTPMIDVMLVLLIIFMIVTPVINSPIPLPRSASADSRPEDTGDITLTIATNGIYLLTTSGGGGSTQRIPLTLLGARLSAMYGTRTRDRILYLKAGTNSAFGGVQQAIEIARQAGVRVVATVTQRTPTPSPSSAPPHTTETHR